MTRISDAVRNEMRTMYEAGASLDAVAAAHGTTPETASKAIKEAGGTVRRPGRQPVVQTHYDGCYNDPQHHACAVQRIELLAAENDRLTDSLNEACRQ